MAPSAFQILVIILLIMFFFGAKRIPGIMENLAKGITSFKKGLQDEDAAEKKQVEDKTTDKDS